LLLIELLLIVRVVNSCYFRLFGIPDIIQPSLANGLVRNMNNQKGNEAAVLATLGCIGNLELKMSKIITELDRLVKADSRV